MTYPGLRMGNILYLALQAYLQQRRGGNVVALCPELENGWSVGFPRLASLLVHQRALRWSDHRIDLPPLFFQRFGTDFTAEELDAFVCEILLDQNATCELMARAHPDRILTLNIRRGDYYSVPANRREYGFDVETYVRSAVRRARAAGDAIATCVIVSDDPAWCRRSLSWLKDDCNELRFHGPEEGVLVNFARVATGRELVLTNSTFSYWAGYVSDALYGRSNRVLVPDLHAWSSLGGHAWQHSPNWCLLPVQPLSS